MGKTSVSKEKAVAKMPRMPFIVAQINVLFWGLVFLIFGGASFVAVRGYPQIWPVLVGLGFAYWFPAVLFAAVPFQPYRGFFDRRGRGSLPKMKDLTELDRRVLVRFYHPRNRRRAVMAILLVSLGILTAWWLSVTWLAPPSIPRLPGFQVVAVIVAMGLPLAFGTGIFAITVDIRRNWESIAAHGDVWPVEVRYPGPLLTSMRSFRDGVLPGFLAGTAGRL